RDSTSSLPPTPVGRRAKSTRCAPTTLPWRFSTPAGLILPVRRVDLLRLLVLLGLSLPAKAPKTRAWSSTFPSEFVTPPAERGWRRSSSTEADGSRQRPRNTGRQTDRSC